MAGFSIGIVTDQTSNGNESLRNGRGGVNACESHRSGGEKRTPSDYDEWSLVCADVLQLSLPAMDNGVLCMEVWRVQQIIAPATAFICWPS